ncbi:MAG: hypothetical protein FJ271_05135 [Planctomycetes bacterium]|nr:hypothetical protein [Planctomycetota bacterium]
MRTRNRWLAAAFLLAAAPALPAQSALEPDSFDRLRTLIRPQDGESRWRKVDWLTSLHEARVKAAVEGKPIILWSGGGAPPLGGC